MESGVLMVVRDVCTPLKTNVGLTLLTCSLSPVQPGNEAAICTTPTATAETGTDHEVAPASTLTLLGRVTIVGSELERFTTMPPSGTGSEKNRVKLR